MRHDQAATKARVDKIVPIVEAAELRRLQWAPFGAAAMWLGSHVGKSVYPAVAPSRRS